MTIRNRVEKVEHALRVRPPDFSELSDEELERIVSPFDFSALTDDDLSRLELLLRKVEAGHTLNGQETQEHNSLLAKVRRV